MSNDRNRVLLILALVLAIARFIMIPWIDQQTERRDNLRVLTQRLNRSEGLLQSQAEILKDFAVLTEMKQKVQSRYPIVSTPEAYRIQAQQEVSTLAAEYGLSVTLFDFILEGEHPESNLRFVRAQVRVEGGLDAVARLHGEIEGRMKNASVRAMIVESVSFPVSGPGDARVRGSINADLYFSLAQEKIKTGGSP